MSLNAQIGLSEIGRVLFFLSLAAFWISLLSLPLFLFVWYFSEIRQFIADIIRRTDPLTRWEEDRRMEGRLIDPKFYSNNLRNSDSYRG